MKNLQKYIMILGTIMLSIGISACSKKIGNCTLIHYLKFNL